MKDIGNQFCNIPIWIYGDLIFKYFYLVKKFYIRIW